MHEEATAWENEKNGNLRRANCEVNSWTNGRIDVILYLKSCVLENGDSWLEYCDQRLNAVAARSSCRQQAIGTQKCVRSENESQH
jgi:hypothetical protein